MTLISNPAVEIPLNASTREIIKHAFKVGVDMFEASGNRKLLRTAFKELYHGYCTAIDALYEHGVKGIDLVKFLAATFNVKNTDKFIEIIREVHKEAAGT